MKTTLGILFFVGCHALLPAAPIINFPALTLVEKSPVIVATLIPGTIIIGRVDIPGTEPGEALTRGNIRQRTDVSIDATDGSTGVCSSAEFVPGTSVESVDAGNLVVTTKDVVGNCNIIFSVTDSLRQTTVRRLTVRVIDPGNRDCVLSPDAFTPPSACDENGLRVQFPIVIREASGTGTCNVEAAKKVTGPPQSLCPKVDCQLTNPIRFGPFGPCDCGRTNKKTRTQLIAIPKGFNGTDCPPPATETVNCAAECPADCIFNPFGDFSPCTASCGGGQKFRTRTIAQLERNGGLRCPDGANVDIQPCNTQPCPVDCEIGVTEFSPCSVTCGGGTKTRQQYIITQPANGGKACPELLNETVACASDPCSIETCKNRCGFVGKLRGGIRSNTADDEQAAPEEQDKQFGSSEKQLLLFFNRFRRPLIPIRPNSTEIPSCSCDVLCARALATGDNCCVDVALECPNVRVLPRRERIVVPVLPLTSTSGVGLTRCPGGVFRSGPSLICPNIPVGARGFYVNCVPCA